MSADAEIPWDYLYTAARAHLRWTEWEFWGSTPRKLLACLEEFWYLDRMRSHEAAQNNLRFIALLFSKDAEIPAPPERTNKSKHVVTTNDAGLAMLKGLF